MTIRLLAVDTASEICGVALAVDGTVGCELIINHGGTHTKTIMDAVDTVLKISRHAVAQIDAFVVNQGPGSFTGLRIGISTVKGLAAAMDKPLVGITSLEVLANQAPGDTPLVCALMDARRNEVYWCLYRRTAQGLTAVVEPQVGPATQIAPYVDGECMFVGNGVSAYRHVLAPMMKVNAQWARAENNDLRPSKLAYLGWEKYRRVGAEDAESFKPIYLRKSDAELNRRQP